MPENYDATPETQEEINGLVKRALGALAEVINYSQEQIDEIVKRMALAGHAAQAHLARAAVEETGMGVYEDKITKNIFATEYIYHSIKYEKTVGIINDNDEEGYFEIAEPVGVIAGVTPVTNPTSTTMFKAIISIKTRNPIIFAFHPSAQSCSREAARIVYEAALAAGAPENIIQWIENPGISATGLLMNHPNVSLVLATGGSKLVRAAYTTGKPALGVGPGNVPCFIEKTANVRRAVTDLILSKTFDNGVICASEQAAIIEAPVYDEVKAYMKHNKCVFLDEENIQKLSSFAFKADEGGRLNAVICGQSAYKIAQLAGISEEAVPKDTKILCCEIPAIGKDYPLSQEKLSPILAVLKANDPDHGIALSEQMLRLGGLGHSSVIHSNDENVIRDFSHRCKTGRVIVNAPSSHGAIGELYNTNTPSLTLGCGSYGNNSTTSNVTAVNLLNKKRVAKRRMNMQWFKIPERIYFEFGSIGYLEKMPDITRAVIVTDESMVRLGYLEKVMYHLRKRSINVIPHEVIGDVEPDPSLETVLRGAEVMRRFQPDVIIALGGGSAIDAAKGMWLFYEQPDVDFAALATKFLDIRKRVYKIPDLGQKARFVSIPTTSGTGSEVTSFAVITDREKQIKYPLADYALTPNVAILDPDFVMTVPPSVTADTGLDVLTHALEAYVSVVASDFTDALALKAVQMVFEYLPLAYKDGANRTAREKMHNASCMAGMAFTNAFLGINHSLAHKLGGEFGIPHGRANAILIPWAIEYNANPAPTKFVSWPKYEHYIAHEKYADIAKTLGLAPNAAALADAVRKLTKTLDMPQTIKDCGIEEQAFLAKLDYLADKAFEDQCTTANPRMPLVEELKGLYKQAYYGV